MASARKCSKRRKGSTSIRSAASQARWWCLAIKRGGLAEDVGLRVEFGCPLDARASSAGRLKSDSSSSRSRLRRAPPRPGPRGWWAGRRARRCRWCRLFWRIGLPVVQVVEDLEGDAQVPGEAGGRLAVGLGRPGQAQAGVEGRLERRRGLQGVDLQRVERREPLVRARRARPVPPLALRRARVWASASWARTSATRLRPSRRRAGRPPGGSPGRSGSRPR